MSRNLGDWLRPSLYISVPLSLALTPCLAAASLIRPSWTVSDGESKAGKRNLTTENESSAQYRRSEVTVSEAEDDR